MGSAMTDYADAVQRHITGFFPGQECSVAEFDRGPIQQVAPGFHVLEVEPGPRGELWTYVSVGAAAPPMRGAAGIEFMLTTSRFVSRCIELLAMITHYHLTGEALDVGHTIPIGEGIVPRSKLDHLLVSVPYPFGPELEVMDLGQRSVRLLWLLPITKAERDFKAQHGLEALEQEFDRVELEFWDEERASVV